MTWELEQLIQIPTRRGPRRKGRAGVKLVRHPFPERPTVVGLSIYDLVRETSQLEEAK